MGEETARAGDIEIVYESFGDPGLPTILLVMGLGVQMLGWDVRFCELLAEQGFRVVRFDNRDVGRSTWIEDGPPPNPMAALGGDFSSASYTLTDMASDTAGLLDDLGVEAAHLVGASMGGMISQTVAIERPERVLSLTSIMSTTGDRKVGQPSPVALQVLLSPPAPTREGFGKGSVAAYSAIGSPGFAIDAERIRERALESFDRGYNPLGVARQLLAIGASGDRTPRLRELDVSTQVIHGTADPLVNRSGGEATAAAIPGARLELIDGMGHDLPRELWARFAELITANARRAG